MSERFVIGDLHLGHAGIVRLRNMHSIEEHDNRIRENWNSQVTRKDIVFVLGDVTMHKASYLGTLDFKNWNGRKILVMGNHDDANIGIYFDAVYGVNEVKACARKYHIVMTHIPIIESELFKWDYNMHGHLHMKKITSSQRLVNPYINVCAEHMNFMPQPLDAVVEDHVARVMK
jgi:calcineurin-like phosphoesterase family protein|tara:strand:- start:108 stop:629 length:522 start_codon:yes stop_codon:yes gene_type:complete